MVLNRKRRLDLFTRIVRAFRKVYDEKFGKVPVEVYVAQALGAEAQDRVADRIGAALGRDVVIHEHVDPSVIGGIRLRVGDQLVDGTVATQLRHMREEILEAGRENARANLQRIVAEG
jgi:F-type H+-transporting ATPase subunit delta